MDKKEIREVVYIDTKVKINEAIDSLNKLEKKFDETQDKKLFGNSFTTLAKQLNGLQKDAIAIKDTLSKGFTGEKDVEKIIQSYSRFEKKLKDFQVGVKGLNVTPKGLEDVNPEIQKIVKSLNDLKSKIKEVNSQNKLLAKGPNGYNAIFSRYDAALEEKGGPSAKRANVPKEMKDAMRGYAQRFSSATTYESRRNIIDEARQGLYSGTDSQGNKFLAPNSKDYKAAKQALEEFFNALEVRIKPAETLFEQLNLSTEQYETLLKSLTGVAEGFQKDVSKTADQVEQDLNNDTAAARDLYDSFIRAAEGSQKLQALSGRIAQLTSATLLLRKAWQVARQSIRDVIDLDEQFNEISIVTGRTMEDMWNSFGAVNSVAQEYGVTTRQVLEVQNLYYHQGKSIAQVNQLTAETLTLAKISGMDYADATDKMTAALNAFKIAANDANRVTDVTAALASNAAADTKEIMNALTKTASIAANAGMSLENTEVFLTKMIETTRESAENLGTALKTITARFTELKQNVDIDEDGVVADFNKVDTALKAAGVSLKDTSGQFRNVDDVFMDLSKVWDDLDRNTQRYIATQAAGSRQQSRFIAMIENYNRTLELSKVAEESAGTGSEQLARSQESLNTAINKIKSSWQDFYTTFIRSDFIKGFLKGVNSFVQGLNNGHTVLKSMNLVLAGIIAKTTIQYTLKKKQYQLAIKTMGVDNAKKILESEINLKYIERLALQKAINREENKKTKTGIFDSLINNKQVSFKDLLNQRAGKFVKSKTGQKLGAHLGAKSMFLETKETKLSLLRSKVLGNAGMAFADSATGGAGAATGALTGILAAVAPYLAIGATIATLASLPAIINKINNAIDSKKAESSIKALEKATENYKETLSKTNSVSAKYKEYQELIKKGAALTADEQEQLKTVTNELAELSPEMVDHYTAEGEAILKKASALEEVVDKQKEELAQERERLQVQKESSAKYGIFDTESAAGQSWKRTTQLASNIDVSGMQEFAVGVAGLSKKEVSEGLQDLVEAKGLNRMSFGDITNDDLNRKQWQELRTEISDKFNNIEDFQNASQEYRDQVFRDALEKTGEYSQGKIDMLVDLNQQLGNSLLETFVNMGDYVETIRVQNAKLEISQLAGDLGLDSESILIKGLTDSLEKTQYSTKIELSDEKLREIGDSATLNSSMAIAAIGKKYTKADKDLEYGKTYIQGLQDIINGVVGADTEINEEDIDDTVKNITEHIHGRLRAQLEDVAKADNGQTIEEYIENLLKQASIEKEQKAIEDFMKKFAKSFSGTQQNIFEKIVGKFSWSTLSSDEDLNNTIKEIEDYAKRLGKSQSEAAEVGEHYRKVLEDQKEEFDEIKTRLDDIQKENNLDFSEVFNLDLDTAQLSRFEDTTASLLADYGSKAAQDYADSFSEALSEFVGQGNFSEIVGKVMDYIEEPTTSARRELERLGIDANKLEALLIKAGNGGANAFVGMEDAAEKLKSTLETLKDVVDSLVAAITGKATLDQLKTLISQFDYTVKDFKATADGFKLVNTNGSKNTEQLITDTFVDQIQRTKNSLAKAEQDFQGEGNLETLAKQYGEAIKQGEVAVAAFLKDKKTYEDEIKAYYDTMMGIELAQLAYEQAIRQERKAIWEAEQENLKKAADKIKEVYDKLKDLYDLLNDIEPSEPIKEIRDYLDLELSEFEKARELNLNVKINKQSYIDEVKTLNKRLATDKALQKESQIAMARDKKRINKNKYVSINSAGVAMVNSNINNLYDRFGKSKSKEERDAIKQEIEEAKKLAKSYNDSRKAEREYSNNALEDLAKLQKVREELYQERANLEKKIKDILIANDNKELENYKKTIEEKKQAQQDYLNSVQNAIDKERQMRDLADKEEDLRKKERKLSILEMDTSGLYAGDVASLRNDIAGSRRDLQDTYVDNYMKQQQEDIGKLQEAYDRDITAWESYLEWKKEDMSQYRDAINSIIAGSEDSIFDFIKKNSEDFIGLTEGEVKQLSDTTLGEIKKGASAIEALNDKELKTLINNLELMEDPTISDLDKATQTYFDNANTKVGEYKGSIEQVSDGLTSMVKFHNTEKNKIIDVWDELIKKANQYKAAAAGITGEYNDSGDIPDLPEKAGGTPTTGNIIVPAKGVVKPGSKYAKETKIIEDDKKAGSYNNNNNKTVLKKGQEVTIKKGSQAYNAYGWESSINKTSENTKAKVADTTKIKNETYVKVSGGDYDGRWFKLSDLRYKHGGYAPFTGPAWLDGTPSHPEAVLNAEDTHNFEQLRDLLRSINVQPGQTATNNSYQDSYTVEITVGELGNDYTVDNLVEDIGEKIYEISTRNQPTRI